MAEEAIVTLIRRCGEKEPAALREFFQTFASDIYNFPMRVFYLDEDQASDFFLYAYERLKEGGRFKSFQGRSTFRTWFYTVLRNLVIDWMRSVRELKTVNITKTDDQGYEYRMIEDTPDPRSSSPEEENMDSAFFEALYSMNLDLRIVFKLSYIYYIDLNQEEMNRIMERTKIPVKELIRQIADLKHTLSEKELKNREAEDKITSLYMSILELKTRREQLLIKGFGVAPDQVIRREQELEKINTAIDKKYRQREKLLEKKEKGGFIVRTPYKIIAELLDMPEGSVSVHMMRAVEKMKGYMENYLNQQLFSENDEKVESNG